MTYGEIKNAIESGEWDNYTDGVDIDPMISLFEYGILRDPKTSECIFCAFITNEEPDDDKEIELKFIEVTFAEVRGYLIDESVQGFFSYIGSDLETELERLDNDMLALTICSINMYDGWFNQ